MISEDVTVDGVTQQAVKDFAVFIDTHRDQPHIGMFDSDIHRGTCKPTLVHLLKPDPPGSAEWFLWHAKTGEVLQLHDKHKFVSVNFWGNFLANYIAEYGGLPSDDKGFMPTKYLRDARAKKYQLRSFRQIVVERG